MKTKILLIFVFLTLLSIMSISSIHASLSDVKYPVAELGNCNSQVECEKYCDDINNMELCLNFAEKNGIMGADEIKEARKFMPFLKSGETPGNCKGQKECDAYCNDEKNIIECIDFAVKAGIMDAKEAEMAKKTGGKGPGGCKGKKQCDDYCNIEANFPTCVDFAVQNGLMDAKDAEMAKKTGGKGPGNCKSKEECDAFCNNEANFPTCVDFAVQNGLMDAKDAEMAKKTGGKGPGNCKSKEECDAFCKNPDNQETCMNFAIEHNLMSESELVNMKKNQEFMNSDTGKCYSQCLKDAGISFKDCPEGGDSESCKSCQDKCFAHDSTSGGRCLSQEKWQQLNQDCISKGGSYHLEEIKGPNGQGGECVVDESCVQGDGAQWETQEEKDKKLAEMQKQWDEERARYEAEHGPGSQQNSGGSGGCTQPGPEGQCNPGPGAGPEPGNENSGGSSGSGSIDSGEQTSGISDSGNSGESSESENSGSDSSGSNTNSGDSGGSDSGNSGGQTSGGSDSGGQVTGAVIMKVNSNGLITGLVEYIVNLF